MEIKSMVQKEIKKKTRIYALIAILSAIVLVSAIYTISNPTTVLVSTANVSPLKVFSSITEMKNFLAANANAASNFTGGPLDSQYYTVRNVQARQMRLRQQPRQPRGLPAETNISYSTTNVQVAGVDEADTVKTDGQYLYTINQDWAAQSQNNVYIVNANPQDPAVVSKIALGNNTSLAGMYLSQNGNTLVVVGSNYANMIVYPMVMIAGGSNCPITLGTLIMGFQALSTFLM